VLFCKRAPHYFIGHECCHGGKEKRIGWCENVYNSFSKRFLVALYLNSGIKQLDEVLLFFRFSGFLVFRVQFLLVFR
jgi:hypothetical protein